MEVMANSDDSSALGPKAEVIRPVTQELGQIEDAKHPKSPERAVFDVSSEHSNVKPRSLRNIKWALLCLAVISAQFLYALDNTIVADVQPSILKEFGETEKLAWIIVAFELGAVSFNLLWGKVYGLFNNKILFLSSVLTFEIGSAICGAAPTMNALIVGRVICGIGGHGIYTGVMSTLSAFTTLQERPLYMSFAGAAWSIGIVPIIGGAFVDSNASWRWAFYINLCVGGVVLPIYLYLLPVYNPMPATTISAKLKRIDIIGVVLFAGAIISGIMATSFGGTRYTWNSGTTIGLFTCSGVLWILFCVHQAVISGKETRIFPVHFLRSWDMGILFAQTSSSISLLFTELYFVPLYLQFVRGDRALAAGMELLPCIFVDSFASVVSGILMANYGWYKPWYLIGSILAVIGATLLRTVGVSTPIGVFYSYTIILGAGIGWFVQLSLTVLPAKVLKEDVSAALAFAGCAQLCGLAFSFSIAYSIFINTATNQITAILPTVSRAAVQAAIAGDNSKSFGALPPELKAMILQAVNNSISYIYDLVLAGACLSLFLSLLMRHERLSLQGDQ